MVLYWPLVVTNGVSFFFQEVGLRGVESLVTATSCLHKNASYCPVSTESQHMLRQKLAVMLRLFGLQSLMPVQQHLHNVEIYIHGDNF